MCLNEDCCDHPKMAEGGRKKGESRAERKLIKRVLARTSLLWTHLSWPGV